MTNTISHTAVLLFSRSSEQECAAKNFLPSKLGAQNKKIAQKLIDRSLQQTKGTDLPFFVWNEEMQQGSTFGEKIAGAVECVFKKGFQKVIIIGNDCLSLTSQQIKSAASYLECNDAVLAPTHRGGVYLIGLTENSFDKKSFTNVRWQTAMTCQDLMGLLAGQDVCQMPLKNDVNNFADLVEQLHLLLRNNPVRIFVENLLSHTPVRSYSTFSFIHNCQPHYSFGSKAPPFLFA